MVLGWTIVVVVGLRFGFLRLAFVGRLLFLFVVGLVVCVCLG